MNCQDFEKMIIALARDQLFEAASREQSVTHAEVCVRCAARFLEEQVLIAGMRTVAAEIASQEAPAGVERALLKAFREHATTVTSPAIIVMPIKPKRWPQRRLTAIAAGILLLISAIATLWLQPKWLSWQSQKSVASPAPPGVPDSQAPLPLPTGLVIDQKVARHRANLRSQKRARQQKYGNSLSEIEIVTEFFPLLEGDDLSSLESGQIVRVEVPGSALLATGLPMDAAMASEPVKADVILGHDGQARAIRFVR